MSNNNYKGVKQAVRAFILNRVNLGSALQSEQVFRAPPNPTDLTRYPVVVIRSATSQKTTIGEYGPSKNKYSLVLGILTRGATSEEASDELDDLLQALDNAVATYGASDLDSSYGQWHLMTRLDQATTFDNPVQDDVGFIVYGATAGLLIEEKLSHDQG